MRTFLTFLTLFTLAGSLTFGAAASHTLTTDDFAAGSVTVESCDSNGVFIELVFGLEDETVIESLTVSDIDSRCITQIMTVVLETVDGFELWSSEVYVDQLLIDVPIVDGAGMPVTVDASAIARASLSITEHLPFQ